MGLSIDIAANTSAAQRGIKDLSKTLDGVADSLDDVAADAARDGDRVERSFRDMVKAAQDAGRENGRAFSKSSQALEDVERQAKRTERAVDDIGDGGHKSFGKMGEAAEEVTQEMGQNLGEAVSSIRGDLTDLGQVGQDTLGGLAATLAGSGPAGIAGAAALAAGAVGLGLVTAEMEKQKEQAEALRTRMVTAYGDAAQAGLDYLDVATIIADTQDLINNPERAEEYQKVLETQKITGIDLSTIYKANAGDLDALRIVQDQMNAARHEAAEAGEEVNLIEGIYGDSLKNTAEYWERTGTAAEDASAKAQSSAQATSDLLLKEIDTYGQLEQRVDDLGNAVVTLPDGKEILIDAKTGRATLDVSKFGKDTDETIRRLNGRDIVLEARASTRAAQQEVNRFLKSVDGKSFRLNGRVTVDSGWD